MSGIALKTRKLVAATAVGVCLSGLSAVAHAQSDEQRAGARSLATEGAMAFNEGRFKDAVELFAKAESLVHAPPHLLFLARAHTKLGQFVKAREAYMKIIKEQFAANAPQAFHDAKVTAEEERKLVEPRIGSLVVKVEGAENVKDLSVTVDGVPISSVLVGVPQPMDPGEHQVAASAPGWKAQPVSVTLKDAGRQTALLKLEPDGSAPVGAAPVAAPGAASDALASPATADAGPSGGSNGLRIGAYVGLGVGVVGLGLGTVFSLQSAGKRSDADEAAKGIGPRGVDAGSPLAKKIAGLDEDADSAKTLGIVGFVVGGVGIAAGVTLFVLSSKKSEPAAAYLEPYLGLGAAGVRGAF